MNEKFYECDACGEEWSRIEFRLNPVKACPKCGANEHHQKEVSRKNEGEKE